MTCIHPPPTPRQLLGRPFQREKEWFGIILLLKEMAGLDTLEGPGVLILPI